MHLKGQIINKYLFTNLYLSLFKCHKYVMGKLKKVKKRGLVQKIQYIWLKQAPHGIIMQLYRVVALNTNHIRFFAPELRMILEALSWVF
jgi:hypothetical protein